MNSYEIQVMLIQIFSKLIIQVQTFYLMARGMVALAMVCRWGVGVLEEA